MRVNDLEDEMIKHQAIMAELVKLHTGVDITTDVPSNLVEEIQSKLDDCITHGVCQRDIQRLMAIPEFAPLTKPLHIHKFSETKSMLGVTQYSNVLKVGLGILTKSKTRQG